MLKLREQDLAVLRELHPDVPPEVWHRLHESLIEEIHLALTRKCVRSMGSSCLARRCPSQSDHRNRRGGARKRRPPRATLTDQDELPEDAARLPRRRRAERLKRPSPEEAAEVSEIVGAVSASQSTVEHIESTLSALPVPNEMKKQAVMETRKAAQELQEVREQMRAEIANQHPAEPSKAERLWKALQSFAEVIMVVFRKVFGSVYDTLSWFTSDSSAANQLTAKARDEAVAEVLRKESAWQKIWRGVKMLGNLALSAIKWLYKAISFVFPSVLQLVKYITANPHTAKMCLIMANFIKKSLCRQMAVWWSGATPAQRSTHNLDVSFFDPIGMAKELSGPVLQQALTDVVKAGAVDSAFDATSDFVSETLSGIPMVGGLLKAITKVAVGSIKESTKEALAFYSYYASVTQSFAVLVDLLDVRQCVSSFQSQAAEIKSILDEQAKASKTAGAQMRSSRPLRSSRQLPPIGPVYWRISYPPPPPTFRPHVTFAQRRGKQSHAHIPSFPQALPDKVA